MARSYICKQCGERKRPVDPEYDVCKSCQPRGRKTAHTFGIKTNIKVGAYQLAA